MKEKLALALAILPSGCYADCAARGHFDSAAEPQYRILACVDAATYLREQRRARGEPDPDAAPQYPADAVIVTANRFSTAVTSEDKAVTLEPANDSASSIMWNRSSETWHFKGDCKALPLHIAVTLETQAHCSDGWPSLYSNFGDVTILAATPT
jgi:hypothetical protein